MRSRLFFSLLLIANSLASPVVIRDSPVTLPLTRHYNFTKGTNIADSDRARLQLLRERNQVKVGQASILPIPATNAIVTYTTSVGIGSPPTFSTLIIDTGSANTWIGAQGGSKPPPGGQNTSESFVVEYGSGFVYGQEWISTVILGKNLVIPGQGIGVASYSSGFGNNVDGILGIGPVDLTTGTTSGGGVVPTVTDTAWKLGLLSAELIGIFFEPSTSISDANGELTFGGVDSSKFNCNIHYLPITSTSPASKYVGIDQTITYGSSRLPILPHAAGITDTGTTLIMIATDAFNAYTSATGAVVDSTTGLLTVTPTQYAALESLFFTIDGVEYEFTKNAQTWPRSLNTAIGGDANKIYLVIANPGQNLGTGLDFIDGYTFLERYYSVFDSGASRFGIAPTPFTFATTN